MKYCRNCGKEIHEDAFVCPNCGVKTGKADDEINIYAGLTFLGVLIPVLGIIFGCMGISKAKELNGKGYGLAVAGLILSIFLIVVYTVALL